MKTSIIFLLSLASALAHPLLSCSCGVAPMPCNCGLGSGEDVCHDSDKPKTCTPLVVRPLEVPKPKLPAPLLLPPVGSPCSCHTSLVKPAVVPNPPCTACSGGYAGSIDVLNNQHLTLSQQQQILFGGGCSGAQNGGLYGAQAGAYGYTPVARPILVDDIEKTPVNPANYVPADPVSLSVAYKMAQEKCHHNEDKLSFGFRSLPKDVPIYVRRMGNNIPEENLFNLNGQIVELKKIACQSRKSLDDEAAEQLADLQEEEEEARMAVNPYKSLTLGELGYGPAKIEGQFVDLPSAGPGPSFGEGAASKNCDDGFKPGNVIITQVPKVENLAMPPPLPEPCPADEEAFIPPPPAVPQGALFTSPYTYLSSASSSSASTKNLYSKSVFLQKVGCS
ncbi:uncharacterized protein LOC100141569 [Tribolium castaneum]|uniref:Uncharacterized protein n=1 Tax=Tribolium castaneum TaxID=7070 RepID=D2A3X5_TRICA|nr:PREDICTED: uncharacterized protein LOC100141569 [Tribolium castaneum]EFA04872.1 hypothetical protein TcasGA2_TC014927 [Tribolium castaneum]|eukprot:XP_008194955.2 PREDICTED: uncharacterized protein LOC100141569 [Tribolium castaneum]